MPVTECAVCYNAQSARVFEVAIYAGKGIVLDGASLLNSRFFAGFFGSLKGQEKIWIIWGANAIN